MTPRGPESYPILTGILQERLRAGRSATLENWLEEADRGAERLRDGPPQVAREALRVRRAMGLAAGLVERLAQAATAGGGAR